ncbi:MAG TPA: LysM peptidoglycan-binding domain-containing protein, partial [Spirochaetales bacterium]|nr:LysM peptidoglycan-binding domain-containing protein [Spirochaetales bacterium]
PTPAAPAKKEGTWHKIKWGDTLWDISIAYYRTPWLYMTIAKANKIKNPDLIISGTWIYIPPR